VAEFELRHCLNVEVRCRFFCLYSLGDHLKIPEWLLVVRIRLVGRFFGGH
jgi:hypothetical protein